MRIRPHIYETVIASKISVEDPGCLSRKPDPDPKIFQSGSQNLHKSENNKIKNTFFLAPYGVRSKS
jgi:hypothetical protein